MSRLFGTDGVRGIANTELTAELAYNLGRAGAYVLTEGTHKPKILVAKDTRISGDMLEAALVAGILSVGAEALCLGVVPTPAVAHLTRAYGADAGVMISASHNPVEYNGIKFFDDKGYKLSDDLEDEIQRVIESGFENVPSPTGANLGREIIEKAALEDYISFAKDTIGISLEGLRVALDCANGASHEAAVRAFRELEAEIFVINDNPDGTNINENCGSTHPEELMEYVVKKKCHMGFAFDGDADRCLAVDEQGNLVDGDFILTICAKYLKELGRLKDDTLVVTVMSNLGLMIACKNEKINTAVTKVGDRYVLEEMLAKGYSLGGEQSGHIIFLDHNSTGDGLVTALQVASIVKRTGKSLFELKNVMKVLPQVLVNAKVPNNMKNIYEEDEEIIAEIKKMEAALDGCGRVLIRPSGTEPLVRVMLEGENQAEIDEMAHNLANMIEAKCN
ncbi:phosphoglucosamine mutase [Clostridium perfringens]|uniref:Phosphoglucosamine mutase n=1 Tax=Clostridium perfringens TaxID=1502 RepID=A0A2X3BQH4_CLOPF|nr:phosphoglucosamine mutase [Clostridium perfringens]SQC06192.1 phosphoglucosamine mutase [Clostridium perfringens]